MFLLGEISLNIVRILYGRGVDSLEIFDRSSFFLVFRIGESMASLDDIG
jgi:hypothetical protein